MRDETGVTDGIADGNIVYGDGVEEVGAVSNYTAGFGSGTENLNIGYLNLNRESERIPRRLRRG